MGKWWRVLVLSAFFPGLCWSAEPTTAPTWERRGTGWQRIDAAAEEPIQDETLDQIEQMIQAKQAQPAKRLVIAWLKTHKDHPLRDRALYLIGQANFLYGDRIMSFYNFDELLDRYPGSRYFMKALERQYEIADAFLKGYKRKFLGIPMLDATEEATEILFRIQQRAPGSEIAEKALLRAADFYYASSDFDIAADAYAAYVRSYPRSPLISRVKLRQAFSALAQFRGVKFDATHVIDARQQLMDLAAQFPRVAEEENIMAIVQRIDAALATKIFVTAEFYRRTHKPSAAAYYYRYLMRTFPEAPEVAEARQKLAGLPEMAAEEPQTTPVPTTRATTQRGAAQ